MRCLRKRSGPRVKAKMRRVSLSRPKDDEELVVGEAAFPACGAASREVGEVVRLVIVCGGVAVY